MGDRSYIITSNGTISCNSLALGGQPPAYYLNTGSTVGGSVTGATNGLTLSGKDVILGGTLTGDTAIDINNHNLSISNFASAFNSGTGFNIASVNDLAVQNDGKIVAVGAFDGYDYQLSHGIIRINSDGSVDDTFVTGSGFNGTLYSVAVQNDGKILAVGAFGLYFGPGGGEAIGYIIRINSDGSVDNTFVPGTGFEYDALYTLTVQNDGKILVGGSFNLYGGVEANGIIRLNSDGSVDNTFVTGGGFTGMVYCMVIQNDGKILVGGGFGAYSGGTIIANNIIRLNPDGSVDNTFVTGGGFSHPVRSIALQADGKILAVGDFNLYSGGTIVSMFIIRLLPNGTYDSTFNTGVGFNTTANNVTVQSDQKILVGGFFSLYNNNSYGYIVRINTDGSADNTFLSGDGFNNSTSKISVQINGKILVVGSFSSYGGVTVSGIVGLNSDGTINDAPTSTTNIMFNGNLIEYVNNYSRQYTNRSLVDKEYADSKVATTTYSTFTSTTLALVNLKLATTNFSTYTGTTATLIGSKLAITDFSTYTGTTATALSGKLAITDFSTYTGTTATALSGKLATSTYDTYVSSNDAAVGLKVATSTFNAFTGTTGTNINLSYWTGSTAEYTALTKNNLTIYYVV